MGWGFSPLAWLALPSAGSGSGLAHGPTAARDDSLRADSNLVVRHTDLNHYGACALQRVGARTLAHGCCPQIGLCMVRSCGLEFGG